jgi:hypothetical protein
MKAGEEEATALGMVEYDPVAHSDSASTHQRRDATAGAQCTRAHRNIVSAKRLISKLPPACRDLQ